MELILGTDEVEAALPPSPTLVVSASAAHNDDEDTSSTDGSSSEWEGSNAGSDDAADEWEIVPTGNSAEQETVGGASTVCADESVSAAFAVWRVAGTGAEPVAAAGSTEELGTAGPLATELVEAEESWELVHVAVGLERSPLCWVEEGQEDACDHSAVVSEPSQLHAEQSEQQPAACSDSSCCCCSDAGTDGSTGSDIEDAENDDSDDSDDDSDDSDDSDSDVDDPNCENDGCSVYKRSLSYNIRSPLSPLVASGSVFSAHWQRLAVEIESLSRFSAASAPTSSCGPLSPTPFSSSTCTLFSSAPASAAAAAATGGCSHAMAMPTTTALAAPERAEPERAEHHGGQLSEVSDDRSEYLYLGGCMQGTCCSDIPGGDELGVRPHSTPLGGGVADADGVEWGDWERAPIGAAPPPPLHVAPPPCLAVAEEQEQDVAVGRAERAERAPWLRHKRKPTTRTQTPAPAPAVTRTTGVVSGVGVTVVGPCATGLRARARTPPALWPALVSALSSSSARCSSSKIKRNENAKGNGNAKCSGNGSGSGSATDSATGAQKTKAKNEKSERKVSSSSYYLADAQLSKQRKGNKGQRGGSVSSSSGGSSGSGGSSSSSSSSSSGGGGSSSSRGGRSKGAVGYLAALMGSGALGRSLSSSHPPRNHQQSQPQQPPQEQGSDSEGSGPGSGSEGSPQFKCTQPGSVPQLHLRSERSEGSYLAAAKRA
jgi:hypothetical protein